MVLRSHKETSQPLDGVKETPVWLAQLEKNAGTRMQVQYRVIGLFDPAAYRSEEAMSSAMKTFQMQGFAKKFADIFDADKRIQEVAKINTYEAARMVVNRMGEQGN